jgi:hypothetical protein
MKPAEQYILSYGNANNNHELGTVLSVYQGNILVVKKVGVC